MTDWKLYIDFNDDGDFDDVGEDVSANLFSFETQIGMESAFQLVAKPSRATFVLRNIGEVFTPEYGSAKDVARGKMVLLQAVHNAVTYDVWGGQIKSVRPIPNQTFAEMECHGRSHPRSERFGLQLYESATADEILSDVLLSRVFRSPLRSSSGVEYARLGVSTVGNCVVGAVSAADLSLDSGVTAFEYVGDQYGASVAFSRLLDDLCTADQGYFYDDLDGSMVFKNRHHLYFNPDASVTWTDVDVDAYDYGYSDAPSRVVVVIRPRSLGDAGTSVYTSSNILDMEAGFHRFDFLFRHTDGTVLGVRNPQLLTSTIWPYQNRSGAETDAKYSERRRQGVIKQKMSIDSQMLANGLRVTIETDRRLVLAAGIVVTGQPLYQAEPIEIVRQNQARGAEWGQQTLELDLGVFGQPDHAYALADYLSQTLGRNVYRVNRLKTSIKSVAQGTEIFSLGMLDVVSLTSTVLRHDSDYALVGIRHEMSGAGKHMVEFVLKPHEDLKWAIVGKTGYDEVDSVRVGF